jgi:hypothetical protein
VSTGGGRHLDVAFYDGDLSGAVSFVPDLTADAGRFIHERLLPRLSAPLPDGHPATVVIASDGELYGHHQPFRDLFLRALVAPWDGAPDAGFDVVTLAAFLDDPSDGPHPEIRIRERTSWSCHHGVARWGGECPDAHDGRWKAPLRGALDRLAGAVDTVTEMLGAQIPGLDDPWAARDGYVDVVLGLTDAEAFAAACTGDKADAEGRARLATLLEAQRWRLAMFASDGWFWEDPARPETAANLRAAAKAARLIDGLAGTTLERRLVADLSILRSPSTGLDGAALYRRALAEAGQPPPA